jgi:hypothetical protein
MWKKISKVANIVNANRKNQQEDGQSFIDVQRSNAMFFEIPPQNQASIALLI